MHAFVTSMHADDTTACTEEAKPCTFECAASMGRLPRCAAETDAHADDLVVHAADFPVRADVSSKHAFGTDACTGLRSVCTVWMAMHKNDPSVCAVASSLLMFTIKPPIYGIDCI
jgi:hypothetical protein